MRDGEGGAFVFRFGNCELDESNGELRVGGTLIEIEPRQRALLLYLLRQPGKILTKEELIEKVWNGRALVETAVGTALARVRKAIGDSDGKIIRNERNKGYVLDADVERRPAQRRSTFELTAGSLIPGRGTWRLVERLGQGGAGEVWSCKDESGARRVFKFSLGADHDGALMREVTLSRVLCAALEEDKRKNYVQVLEWNIEVHPYHIEFEYAGVSLRSWAAQSGGLNTVPFPERVELMARIAAAVGDAHSVGIIHKDLKPDNILIEKAEGHTNVRITDFGAGHLLARDRAEQLDITVRGWTMTQADAKSGTLHWMAPELFEGGGATLQSDLYSLGVMLYQLVVGDFARVLAPDWSPEISDPVLRDDIEAVTKRNPAQRLGDAHELARRLRSLDSRREESLRSFEAQARAAWAEEIVRRAQLRRPYLALALFGLIGGLIIGTYFYCRQVQQTREARALADFMTEDLLQAAQTISGGAPSISLRDAMLKSIGLAQKRFASEPQLESKVLQSFGNTFSTLGDYGAMEQVVRRQAHVDEILSGAHSAQTLSDHLMLGQALLLQGKVKEAENELTGVRRFADTLISDRSFFHLWMETEADFAFQQSNFMGAYHNMERLITYYEHSESGSDHSSAALDAAYLWAIEYLLYAGKPQEAEKIILKRLPILATEGDEGRSIRLLTEEALHSAERDSLKFDLSDKGFAAICAEIDQQFGADNKDAAGCRQQQAQLDEDLGRWTVAADRLRIVDKNYHGLDGCPGTSMCIYADADYSFALSRAGHHEEALTLARKAVSDAETSTAPEKGSNIDPTALPHALYVFARVALDNERLDDAGAATDQYYKLISLTPATGDSDWLGRYELLLGIIASHSGNVSVAHLQAERAINLFSSVMPKAIVENNDAIALFSQRLTTHPGNP